MKISKDLNGNKILKVTKQDLKTWCNTDSKGFSIQTLSNLPETHKEGVFYGTEGEVFNYINQFGTKRQKKLVGADQDLTIQDFQLGHTYEGNKLFKELSNDDIDQLVEIIGGRKKDQIKSILTYHLKSCNFWSVANRFMYNHKLSKWSYCAGQDYIFEMAQVRKELLK